MWLFGGIITLLKFWVNIAAAKNATARNVSLLTIDQIVFHRGREDEDATGSDLWVEPSSMCSPALPAMMYCVSSVASVCQPSRFPGSTSYTIVEDAVVAVPSVNRKGPGPMNGRIILCPDFSSLKFI